MKRLIALSGVFFAATCVIATAAIAADNNNQDDPLNGRTQALIVRTLERRLNVTDAQRTQIREILVAERPTLQSLAERAAAERGALRAEEAQGFDEQKVRAFAAAHQQTATDLFVEREKLRAGIVAVLTPEQRQKLDGLRAQWGSRMLDRLSTLGDQL